MWPGFIGEPRVSVSTFGLALDTSLRQSQAKIETDLEGIEAQIFESETAKRLAAWAAIFGVSTALAGI